MAQILPPKKRKRELKIILQSLECSSSITDHANVNDEPSHCENLDGQAEPVITPPPAIPKTTRKCRKKLPNEANKDQLSNPVAIDEKVSGSTSKPSKTTVKADESKPLINSNICRYCGKFYTSAAELKEHEINHTVNKELLCPQCGMGFARRSYLVEHACIHSGEKPHKCYYCDRAFTLKCNLVRHVRIHTGEKPFVCGICKKDFTLKKNMIEHKRTHTGEKPFDCKLCDQRFSRRSSLVRHLRIHTGEKCYECNECHKKFSWKYYLQRHMAIHIQNGTRQRKRRKSNKQKKETLQPIPPKTDTENCENHAQDNFIEIEQPGNFVEHSYAMESNPVDESRFEFKEEQLYEDEEIEFKEESDALQENEPSGSERTLQQEPKQLSVVVAPLIIGAHSLKTEILNPPPPVNPTPQISNDIIHFRMTRNEFENFCGRRLNVRLQRLEEIPFEMQEE